ncbi:ABC transporter permease [Marinoscillum sp.]|uniref:ABC transporter permease n=1 Tax=Marinoscillum sp. TaxID=2024838 RepID=UPI003BA97A95
MNTTRITALNYTTREYFLQIYDHRHIIKSLVRRDLKIKYSQSVLGWSWAFIQPVTALIIYSIFFRYVFDFQFDKYPYALYVLSGILPWHMFSQNLHQSSGVLLSEQELIRKIAFPKFILLLAKSIVSLIELSFGLILLLIYLTIQSRISWYILLLPAVILINHLVSMIIPIWISQFSVKKRDLLHLIPYLVNFGIWLTPIFYTIENTPKFLSTIIYANPMTGVILTYRLVLFGDPFPLEALISPAVCIGLFLLPGIALFKNFDKKIVDHI